MARLTYSEWHLQMNNRLRELAPLLQPGMIEFLTQRSGNISVVMRHAHAADQNPADFIDTLLGLLFSRDAEKLTVLLASIGVLDEFGQASIVLSEGAEETMH